jgi:hypothetical protein
MTRIRKLLPSPAIVIAMIALVAAMAGTSIAAISLGALSKGAKNKTVGVGPLTYVGSTTTGSGNAIHASATCRRGFT